jgi:hypothetical protein
MMKTIALTLIQQLGGRSWLKLSPRNIVVRARDLDCAACYNISLNVIVRTGDSHKPARACQGQLGAVSFKLDRPAVALDGFFRPRGRIVGDSVCIDCRRLGRVRACGPACQADQRDSVCDQAH